MSAINDTVKAAIAGAIAGAQIEVSGDGRHFHISVTSSAFEGLGTLERHRMVLSALKELMAGDDAPVHAIDSLKTHVG